MLALAWRLFLRNFCIFFSREPALASAFPAGKLGFGEGAFGFFGGLPGLPSFAFGQLEPGFGLAGFVLGGASGAPRASCSDAAPRAVAAAFSSASSFMVLSFPFTFVAVVMIFKGTFQN